MSEEHYRVLGIEKTATPQEIRAAYRKLAARWHPDRFPEGPERAWAESRMILINEAYNALSRCCPKEELTDAAALLRSGDLRGAAHILLSAKSRTPEWNYLYGTLLSKRGDEERARVYYALAARGCPENGTYSEALDRCTARLKSTEAPISRILSVFRRKSN